MGIITIFLQTFSKLLLERFVKLLPLFKSLFLNLTL